MAYITNTKISLEDIVDANIPNTDALPIDLKELKGNTTQNGTPTPTNPVSVENVTGEQEVIVCGKNLFDKDNLEIAVYNFGTTGVVPPKINSTTRVAISPQNAIKVSPNTTYVISSYNTTQATIGELTNDRKLIRQSNWQNINYSFTTSSTTEYIMFNMLYGNNETITDAIFNNLKNSIQIEQGTATPYEPYQGKTYNINLGKNLLPTNLESTTIQGLTITRISNGSYKLNGTITTATTIELYTGSNITIQSGTYTGSITNRANIVDGYIRLNNGSYQTIFDNSHDTNTFTITEPFTFNRFYIYIGNNRTFDNQIITVQLEKGSQATSFSPYKTPIELCKIGNYQDLIRKSTGKNLFDKDNANVLNVAFNTGGVNTLTDNANAVTIYIPCKKNTIYTFSKSLGARFFVGYTKTTPATGVEVFERAGANDSTKWTITTGNEAQYLVALVYNSSVDTSLTQTQVLSTIQIEEGNIQTPVYEPYGKVWYIKKNIGKVVLDGSEDENWIMGNNSFGKRFTYRYLDNSVISDTTNGKKSLCNYFPLTVNAGTWNNKNCYVITSNKEFICTLDETYTTLEQFKTWLSTHNTSVYYVLANPTYEVITDDELISQLEKFSKARTYRTQTNINQINNNLPFFIDLDVYSTENLFESVIYSQENDNKCKIYFNDVELQDADEYLEKITFTKRVLPENGKKVFGLDNFIAEEVEIIIHDIDTSIIQDKVRIELGTLVNNTYEYVPMGIYNIQDTPTRNDDKITIKLRDNAVLFDFNYNGYPLIEQQGGSATKMQILQDICSQANVNCNVESFLGDSDLIGTYDNTVKGRMYVAYLAEQAGCIAKIDRNGNLIFIPLNNLITHRIPLSIVSKYVKGTPYKIERIVYELGTIKFETSNDETLQTLYISSSNPYISTQEQIESIFNEIGGFEINSTEILSNIIGNPSIDGYDLIEVYDDENINETILFKTFANNTFIYNGKFKSKYKTEIGLEERKENTTNNSDEVFKKTIKSEVDRLDGKITTEIAETKTYTDDKTNTLRTDLQGQISNVDTDLQEYKQTISTTFQQTTESFDFRFTNITDLVGQVSNTENEHYEELIKYIRFVNGVIILGEEGNELTAELSNNRLSFKQNGNEVAYISNQKLYITDTEVLQNIIIGNFAFIPRSNGSLSFRKVR